LRGLFLLLAHLLKFLLELLGLCRRRLESTIVVGLEVPVAVLPIHRLLLRFGILYLLSGCRRSGGLRA